MTYTGAMVLPQNAVVMQEEEMRYLDGGKYFSRKACRSVFTAMAINPTSVVAGAFAVYSIAKLVIKCAGTIGGILGVVIKGVGTWAAGQLYQMTMGLAKGALKNGVDMTFRINISKYQFGVSYTVR